MRRVASAEALYAEILDAAQVAFKDVWQSSQGYVAGEFRALANQLADIAHNLQLNAQDASKGYPARTGRLLLQMQRNACESLLVATTQLTLLSIQAAMDAVLNALRTVFSSALASVL